MSWFMWVYFLAGLLIKVDDILDRTDWFYDDNVAIGDSERFYNLILTKVNNSLRVQFNSGKYIDSCVAF